MAESVIKNNTALSRSIYDNTVSDAVTLIENHWSEIPIGVRVQNYLIRTQLFTWVAIIYKHDGNFGACLIFGYGDAKLRLLRRYQGEWTVTEIT